MLVDGPRPCLTDTVKYPQSVYRSARFAAHYQAWLPSLADRGHESVATYTMLTVDESQHDRLAGSSASTIGGAVLPFPPHNQLGHHSSSYQLLSC